MGRSWSDPEPAPWLSPRSGRAADDRVVDPASAPSLFSLSFWTEDESESCCRTARRKLTTRKEVGGSCLQIIRLSELSGLPRLQKAPRRRTHKLGEEEDSSACGLCLLETRTGRTRKATGLRISLHGKASTPLTLRIVALFFTPGPYLLSFLPRFPLTNHTIHLWNLNLFALNDVVLVFVPFPILRFSVVAACFRAGTMEKLIEELRIDPARSSQRK